MVRANAYSFEHGLVLSSYSNDSIEFLAATA